MTGSTITATVTSGVTLGSGSYPNPLTVTSTGDIAPTGDGAVGLFADVASGYVLNQGTIAGGADTVSVGPTDVVGLGVYLGTGSLTNEGTIYGGAGEVAAAQASSGIYMTDGSLTNTGAIIGGAGEGYPPPETADSGTLLRLPPGNGGAGVVAFGGSLTNVGTITGGAGGSPGVGGGAGGDGVDLFGGSLTNTGTIVGGVGGAGGFGVALMYGGTLINTGFIGEGDSEGVVLGWGDAIYFGTAASRLVLGTEASLNGGIIASGTVGNVLELASGSGVGTISHLTGNVPDVVTEQDGITGFSTIQFDSGATWLVAGDTLGLAAGQTIDGFAYGDTIEVTGVTVTGSSYAGGVLTLDDTAGSVDLNLSGNFITSDLVVTNNASGAEITPAAAVPCFAAGTRIATERGAVAVEHLDVGDVVLTVSGGKQAIQWIGHRRVDCRRHMNPTLIWPIRISPHAFGQGRPERALLLSPGHAVFVENVLIPIQLLINDRTIRQIRVDDVSYYHIELPRHDIVLAEGLPAESYLETGGRAAFANSGVVLDLHPDFVADLKRVAMVWACFGYAPLTGGGEHLVRARRKLHWQATMLDAEHQVSQAAP